MRHSYRNELRILVVLAMLSLSCFAYAAPTAAASQASPTSAPPGHSGVYAGNNMVEEAGLVPDSRSLLPVAAIIGFSFLFGGIVCSIKPRP